MASSLAAVLLPFILEPVQFQRQRASTQEYGCSTGIISPVEHLCWQVFVIRVIREKSGQQENARLRYT
ncbi:MAG: hypothetical protein WDA14_02210 [Sphaerochaetaceae bacterium]|nr:hypothetical protein [Sphaerochaetaceae bacterium]MDD4841361.1 hypothetical protein [Sphaerochaetaceae bacterium]NLO59987.1 hypothetical protein [Spirochaetales bacterium]